MANSMHTVLKYTGLLCDLTHVFFRGALGSLRLQLRLRDESVLPSSYYQPLTELLLQSTTTNNVSVFLCSLLFSSSIVPLGVPLG